MTRREPVGSILRTSASGSWGADGSKFVCCVDGRDPQMHEVWCFGSNGITREVHPTVRVEVGAGIVGNFSINYLTENGRRVFI